MKQNYKPEDCNWTRLVRYCPYKYDPLLLLPSVVGFQKRKDLPKLCFVNKTFNHHVWIHSV